MGLDTNFNQDPYYDDYNEAKGYHRILFKPGVAVQARELTQLQTILQNQVERFGNNILKEGTIVKGCNFNYITRLPYVKIKDLQVDGQPVVMSSYGGLRAVGLSSGVEAYVLLVQSGLESQSPNLNTLFVRYLTSNGANKTFSSTEQIQLQNFTTGAVIATVEAAGTVTGESATTIGNGVGLKVSDGVIYQKGTFISVNEQTIVVERYSVSPDNISVGFVTTETIINSFVDTTLLDNAQGYNNENAPGADRVRLTPVLTVKTTANAIADETFFTLVEYQNGKPVRIKDTTQYSIIGEEFARRTEEESGDYVIQNFPIAVKSGANSSVLDIGIGRGLAYVGGKRIQTYGTLDVEIDAGTESSSVDQQNVTTNIGHYVLVNEYMGNFDFNQIVTVDLYDTAQDAFTGGSIVTSPSGSKIGEAKVRGVEYHSGAIGTAATQYKMYIFDIRMTANTAVFSDTKHIYYNGTTDGNADTVLENSKAVLKDESFKRTLWNIGVSAIKTIPSSTSDFVYRTANTSGLTVSTGGASSITLTGSDQWTYGTSATLNASQKSEIVLICNETQSPYTKGKPIDLSGATVTTSGQTLSISGLSNPAAEMDIIAYYNVKKTAAAPAEKESKTVYVKVQANTNPGGVTGQYSLGLPDVYSIQAVYKADNGSYSETVSANNLDVTSNFRLFPNQRDAFYDLSYVKKTAALTIGADDVLLFKVSVFQENNSGSYGDGYFSVDSYTGIEPQDIPVYRSESGASYDLRNVVDFRPYCSNTVVYSTTIGGATVVSTAVGANISFPSVEQYVVAPNQNMEIDYEYYLPRIDRLFLDSEGNFKIIRGVASENPTIPASPAKGMPLATIKVPAYPSLTSLVANRAGKPGYAVRIIRDNVIKGYTMRDIAKLDRRISQLEYYTVLSALETQTKDKAILDENGLDRFKNGIFTDSFEDLSLAAVGSSEFSAAIDPAYKEITPKLRQFDIDLKVSNTSNVTDFGKTLTLSKSDISLINQSYATNIRNCVSDFYSFKGTAYISPEYDSGYDLTRAPDYNLDIDLATPFMDFAESINQFVPLQQVSRSTAVSTITSDTSSRVDEFGGFVRAGTQTTTIRTNTETLNELQIGLGGQTTENVGDFVTDLQFKPFMREREIKVLVFGLRPSTTYHFFFDGDNVDEYVATAAGSTLDGLKRSSPFNTTVTSDANGTLKAIFKVPAETYFVGDRKLEIYDVSSYTDKTTSISSASATYSAFNYSVEKQAVNISTRAPDINVNTSTTQTVAVRTSFQPVRASFQQNNNDEPEEGDSAGEGDPIAQTFLIKPGMVRNDNVLYTTKMDLYFESKSTTAGFTLYLAEVENGIITSNVLPFSKIHVNASDVTTSADASEVTTVTFPSPIPLLVGSEYAFIIKPDGNNPDYRVWIARTGETDVTTSKKITQDVNDGVLFTSSNDRTWTPHQDENIKYRLWRANFSSASGYVEFTNKESEYFSVENTSGTFSNDEYVFVNNSVVAAQTVNVVAGNTTISGSGTTFSSYFNVGGHIVVAANSTVYDVLKISAIANNTQMTVEDVPKYSNTVSEFFKSIVGNVTLFDNIDPAILYLDNSTASASDYFAASDVLIGATSGAQATITSVDNKKASFIAPNIYRTNTTQTKTTLSGTRLFRSDTSSNYSRGNIEFNNYTFLNNIPTVIKSRSNELADSDTERSFTLKATLQNTSGATPIYSSPMIDGEIASMKVFEYIINNDSTDEDTSAGSASSKYITKAISLADSLDAEDLKIYLTAYRPPNTTIEVYAKMLSVSDSDSLDQKPWTQLDGAGTNSYSQNANRFDFKEYEFNLPTSAPVTGAAFLNNGVFEYTDGTFKASNFKYFVIKVVLRSTSFHSVPRLRDIRAIALA